MNETLAKNVVLVGFMGAGKSSVTKVLSRKLGRPVLSTDEFIVREEGRPITDIFRDSGEPYFREVEKRIVNKVANRRGVIIDCGGGVVINPENVVSLKRTGILFYLKATPKEIFQRVKAEQHRPLLQTPNPQDQINSLLAKRAEFYQNADHMIDTNEKTVDQVCQEIMALIKD
jgi:shikimate kinase